jgi:hypothetical protein
MKTIIIYDMKYNVYGKNELADNPQPHISIASSGEIPSGKQLSLLKAYLHANGITPIETATTHWCINQVLGMEAPERDINIVMNTSEAASTFLQITEANIEKQDRLVQASDGYGKENLIIHDVLNTYPKNDDLNTIAIKIALIDVTNSTHLSQYKSQISLYDLANVILNIKDFDRRLSNGDSELVNIIARNTGAINLFSFASKYCTYHNVEIYGRDDYSIFDGIVRKTLPHYVKGLSAYKIDCWRTAYDYVAFNNCIGELLNKYNIHIPFRRRKFDYFLWYANR